MLCKRFSCIFFIFCFCFFFSFLCSFKKIYCYQARCTYETKQKFMHKLRLALDEKRYRKKRERFNDGNGNGNDNRSLRHVNRFCDNLRWKYTVYDWDTIIVDHKNLWNCLYPTIKHYFPSSPTFSPNKEPNKNERWKVCIQSDNRIVDRKTFHFRGASFFCSKSKSEYWFCSNTNERGMKLQRFSKFSQFYCRDTVKRQSCQTS